MERVMGGTECEAANPQQRRKAATWGLKSQRKEPPTKRGYSSRTVVVPLLGTAQVPAPSEGGEMSVYKHDKLPVRERKLGSHTYWD